MAKIGYLLLMIVLSVKILELHAACITRDKLLENLTDKSSYYSKYPPGYDKGVQNNVTVQLEIVDLTAISEQNMEYTATMIVRMNWIDERLNFIELANFSRLVLAGDTVSQVWRPDLFISSERKTVAQTFLRYEEMAYIYPTGEVRFSIRISMTNLCKMQLRHYPFDEQKCTIVIESYAFPTDMMVLEWSKNAVLYPNLELPNFEITVEEPYSGSLSNENDSLINGTFSSLCVPLTLKRKSSAYGTMYFAPYPLFFIIAMSSFAFKDQIGSRITLCTTGMTTSVLQWIGIYARLPPVAYLTYLDGWILAHVCLIGLILVYHAFWYMCLHQAHKEQDQFEEMLRDNLLLILPKNNTEVNDEKFVKDELKDKRSLNGFLNSITDEFKKDLLTSDKRYKFISTLKREQYFEGFVDRLETNIVMKAIKRNPLDFSVFSIFIVVYSLLPVLFVFWAAEDDMSKKYLLFLLIGYIPVGALIAFNLIVLHVCRGKNCRKDCETQHQKSPTAVPEINTTQDNQEPQNQSFSGHHSSIESSLETGQEPTDDSINLISDRSGRASSTIGSINQRP